MLLTREEMSFDFGGKKLDPVRDRDVLAWAVNQSLYGEVTGIQVGHWIYGAPDLDAARFLSRQAVEEFQHVGNFLRILQILGAKPEPPNRVIRFLSTGAMPDTWPEHVAMEMAIGEGLVLQAFYAMIDTVEHDEIVAILTRGVRQEERHVDFGERRTTELVRDNPGLKRRLLGQALVTILAIGQLERFMTRKLPMDHPVLRQLPRFVEHSLAMLELRLLRMGMLDRPLAELGSLARASLIAGAYGGKALEGVAKAPLKAFGFLKPRRLTDTYLDDPLVRDNLLGAQTDEDVGEGRARPSHAGARA